MADYIKTVVDVMKRYEDAEFFKVRLVISVNRATPYPTAEAIVNATISLKSELAPYIVSQSATQRILGRS